MMGWVIDGMAIGYYVTLKIRNNVRCSKFTNYGLLQHTSGCLTKMFRPRHCDSGAELKI